MEQNISNFGLMFQLFPKKTSGPSINLQLTLWKFLKNFFFDSNRQIIIKCWLDRKREFKFSGKNAKPANKGIVQMTWMTVYYKILFEWLKLMLTLQLPKSTHRFSQNKWQNYHLHDCNWYWLQSFTPRFFKVIRFSIITKVTVNILRYKYQSDLIQH